MVHSHRHDGRGALGGLRRELSSLRRRRIGEPLAPAPSFDYEAKRWGAAPLRPRPWFMNGLKLRYLLEDLSPVQGLVLDVGCGVGRVPKPGGGFHIVLPLEGQPRTLYRLVGAGTRWTAKMRHGGHVQLFAAERFRAMASACGLPVRRTRWSYHLTLQVLDLLYFTWLDLRGPVSGSVEDMSVARGGVMGGLMRAASRAVATTAWGEARLLRRLPGGCGHFSCVRAG